MVEKQTIKISATPKTIVNLHDNEVLTLEESKESLNQFKKNELIEALLLDSDDYSFDEDLEDEEPKKEVLETEVVKETVDVDEDDDFADF